MNNVLFVLFVLLAFLKLHICNSLLNMSECVGW